jgi:peptidoglycan/LPS O-acetylase OafA/YrhL
MENNKSHFYWLDALRFVAAFMVLFSHTRNDYFMAYGDLPASQHGVATFVFYTLGRLGHEAVVVFFVLSGFLVGGRCFERIQNGTMNVKSYLIDRFARIYPPPNNRYNFLLHNLPFCSN